jgi:hypothetical protein
MSLYIIIIFFWGGGGGGGEREREYTKLNKDKQLEIWNQSS